MLINPKKIERERINTFCQESSSTSDEKVLAPKELRDPNAITVIRRRRTGSGILAVHREGRPWPTGTAQSLMHTARYASIAALPQRQCSHASTMSMASLADGETRALRGDSTGEVHACTPHGRRRGRVRSRYNANSKLAGLQCTRRWWVGGCVLKPATSCLSITWGEWDGLMEQVSQSPTKSSWIDSESRGVGGRLQGS